MSGSNGGQASAQPMRVVWKAEILRDVVWLCKRMSQDSKINLRSSAFVRQQQLVRIETLRQRTRLVRMHEIRNKVLANSNWASVL